MNLNKIYPWHQIYQLDEKELEIRNWNLDEFERTSNLMKEFSTELSCRSSEINPNNNNDYKYEINIQNKYREDKHIDSYWWVNIKNKYQWWPSDSIISLFNKYGWSITFE